MAPIACREPDCDALTREGITSVILYWPISQRTYWHDGHICLGENPSKTFKHFDLCYSFKLLCHAEYGGTLELDLANKNYMQNYSLSAEQHNNRRIPYESALRILTFFMFSHYINHLENTGPWRAVRPWWCTKVPTIKSPRNGQAGIRWKPGCPITKRKWTLGTRILLWSYVKVELCRQGVLDEDLLPRMDSEDLKLQLQYLTKLHFWEPTRFGLARPGPLL